MVLNSVEEWGALASRRVRSLALCRERVTATDVALVAVLVAGGALRVWLMHVWRPAFLGYPDSGAYLYSASLGAGGLSFSDPYRPAGYPLFLSWLHAIRADLAFAIGVQHVMGLASAVLLYVTVTRFARRRWVALLPAIVVAFAGSELYLEHAALSETLYTLLVIGAIWCAARSLDSAGRREAGWLGASGLLIGLSATVRSVGVFVGPMLVLWAAATHGGWRYRLRRAAVIAVAFVLPVGGYMIDQQAVTGTAGLTRTTGQILYARAAIFADCRDFTPPAGTRGLCQPPGAPRLGPAWHYQYDADSPAVRLFGTPPYGRPYRWPPDGKLEAFALAAITRQPWQYAWTTIEGLVKYVAPNFGSSTMLEGYNLHDPQFEAGARPFIAAYYPHHAIVHHSLSALDDYARAARVEGPVTGLLLALMLAGVVLARERRRAAAALLGATTFMMLLAPVAFLYYAMRYATPAYGPSAAGAAIGLDELIEWVRGRRSAISRPGPRGA